VLSSLSLHLFLWLFGLIVVAFAAYALFSIRSTSRQWDQVVNGCAERVSELIRHATHHGMLLNQKEYVHQIINTVVQAPGVEDVRIYDKDGEIIFSVHDEEIGRRVDLRAEACVSCHEGTTPLEAAPEGTRVRVFERASGERVLGRITPIVNAPECSQAACHAHAPDQRVLGVLDVTMSMAEHDARLATARRRAVYAAVLVALLAGCLSAVFIVRMVRSPVRRLIEGAQRVAGGDLDTEIRNDSRNEIGRLAVAFNSMTRDLRHARAELRAWSERLEVRLREKTEELGRTQREISHMDKMASLGKLAATVAHELNNPLAGILNYAKLVERTIDETGVAPGEQQELRRYLNLIQKEAGRSGAIVKNLLIFARRSGVDLALHGINPVVERAAMLVRHHLEMSNVTLEATPLEGDDTLVCDSDQLEQALVALLVNAVEAMPNGGLLRLAAEAEKDSIVLTVADTGVGVPDDALPHIFEPFFSLKDEGDGSGLGLAVVYGIVQRHHGRIDVESTLGEGTRFRIVLPRRQPSERGEELA
jgi:two-component system NtrC family sensor kinase